MLGWKERIPFIISTCWVHLGNLLRVGHYPTGPFGWSSYESSTFASESSVKVPENDVRNSLKVLKVCGV